MSIEDSTAKTTPPTEPSWTEKQLPPVKPPTTGLLMQLFFVPMVIVSIIVSVWLMFGWLAQSGTNPEQLASNLKQLNKGSWQDAHSLSNLLFDPREEELRHDKDLATSLADTLNILLDDKALSTSEESIKLATWLCRAIGAFEIDAGLDTLVKATKSSEFEIRREAFKGLSTLAANLDTDIKDSRSDIVEVLSEPAMERAESPEREEQLKYGEIRSTVAFTLGVIGGDDAAHTLSLMLSDAYPEARYNAAIGLARMGDERAIPKLCEVMSLDNTEATLYEKESGTLRSWKQNLIIKNGLLAVKEMYTVNETAPIDDRVVQAVAKLEGKLPTAETIVLEDVSRLIESRK